MLDDAVIARAECYKMGLEIVPSSRTTGQDELVLADENTFKRMRAHSVVRELILQWDDDALIARSECYMMRL